MGPRPIRLFAMMPYVERYGLGAVLPDVDGAPEPLVLDTAELFRPL